MAGHPERAGNRLVLGHVFKKHQAGANEGFAENEKERGQRGITNYAAASKPSESKNDQANDQKQRETACHSMTELDDCFDARRSWQHASVAQGPVAPTTGS